MDKVRELRYLTPPTFFLGMLLLGAWSREPHSLQTLLWQFQFLDAVHVAAISAALVAALFPVGFTIQSISINLQRLTIFISRGWSPHISSKSELYWSSSRNPQHYFACFSTTTWENIARALHLPVDEVRRYPAPSSIWQFEKWDKRVVESTVRLWTAFNIAAGSIVAIAASLIVGHFALNIPYTGAWLGWSFGLIVLFTFSAWSTWNEHMKAFEFQSLRLDDKGHMPGKEG